MTRIYTIGLENRTEKEGAYLVIQVAHRNSAKAGCVAVRRSRRRSSGFPSSPS